MSKPETTEREVFRAEAREGQHVRLIACGEPDELLLDGLAAFIAWRRRRECAADWSRQANLLLAENAHLKEVLTQALDCLNDETPEDCSREEAREDTIQKIREALNGR